MKKKSCSCDIDPAGHEIDAPILRCFLHMHDIIFLFWQQLLVKPILTLWEDFWHSKKIRVISCIYHH